MMNIGFDAKRAFLNKSGLGNYARTLIHSLHNLYPENNYLLFTPSANKKLFSVAGADNLKIIQPGSAGARAFPALWRSFFIADDIARHKADIYHGLSNELPFSLPRSIKKVVTIHDLIFLRYPALYPFFDRQIYKLKFKKACLNADKIIADSNQTKNDIIDFFNIPEEKIKVIYLSCNPSFYNTLTREQVIPVKEKYNLPGRYLLYVGTIEERKSLLTIVKALNILKDEIRIPLVVIGKARSYIKTVNSYIAENKIQDRVIFLSNVSSADLPAIYQSAEIFIYPSVFEGFGIPVLEALHSKVPVITSKTSCLPEAGGPGSAYIDPLNAEELAGIIKDILSSPHRRSEMVSEGLKHAEKFKPEAIAAQVMNLYKSIM